MEKIDLRERMPRTARYIDWMRERMGEKVTNDLIKRAMRGEPGCFFSQENGLTFGTRDTRVTSIVRWDEWGVAYSVDPPWMIEALQLASQRGITIERLDPSDPDETDRLAVQLREILAEVDNGR